VCWPLHGKEIQKNYIVKVSGIKIGELSWEMKVTTDNYTNNLKLKSKGLLSSLYNFKGEYFSEGVNNKNELYSKKYTHFWQTKKNIKKMELGFNKSKLVKINQEPVEKEKMRLNVFDAENTNDPLTSFLKIMMGKKIARVVDGRRLYTMEAESEKDTNQTTIKISNYYNLWADHKRNKFEKIIFEKKANEILPFKMLIFFDGRVFVLEEN
jgi:hypothetical protein